MTKAKRSVFIGVALGGIACVAALLPSPAFGGQRSELLVYCSEGDPEGFYPAIHTTGTTFDASSRQVYDRLFWFNPDGDREPALAESFEISDDGLVYTFHLRRGVTFHSRPPFVPTRNFNADDVVLSLNRQRGDAGYEYWDSMGMGELLVEEDDIVALDENTVQMTLSEPNTTLPAILAMDFTAIISAEYRDYLESRGALAELNTHPIGTGPYQFVVYVPGAQVRFRAHPGYWRGPPPTETLVFAITPDAIARYRRLRVDDCQIMSLPSPADVPAMRNNPEIEVLQKPGFNLAYLAWNTERPPFDNSEVRVAMSMAIDVDGLRAAVYRGTAEPAKSPIPPGMQFHAADLEGHEYDPGAARQRLADAGISGLRTTIYAPSNIERGYMPNFRLAAELIQRDLAAIGVDADVRLVPWLEFLVIAADRNRDGAVVFGWTADHNDADNFVGLLLTCAARGGLNSANWCDDEFDERVRRARTITDGDEREKLYRRAQEIFIEQAPWVPIAHAPILKPVRRELCGYEVDPFGLHDFYGARLCEGR